MSHHYLSEHTFKPKTYNGFTLVDYRLLTKAQRNKMAGILHTAILTATPEILCGGPETESLAVRIQNDIRGGIDAEELDAFMAQYRAEQNTRTTQAQFIGAGVVKFGLFSGTSLIGSVHICQSSVLSRNGDTINIRITPLVHRLGVRIMNPARTAFNAQFIQDQAMFSRFVLNNEFDVMRSPLVVKPILTDSHPRNGRFENMRAVIDFDSAFEAIMATFSEINSINGAEGARAYKLFKLVTTVL